MDGVFNYMEIVVKDKLDKLISENNVCVCEKCKKSIFARSLNSLPPYYISTDIEKITAKLTYVDKQSEADVVTGVTKAINAIASTCNHVI